MSTATVTPPEAPTAPAAPVSSNGRDKPLGGRFIGATSNYIDERTSLSGFIKELGRKIFPDHWSFMLGEIALWSFVVVLLSGTFLTFFFQASMVETHYNGAFLPMRGIEMSAAMASTLEISFDLRGGLLVRQIHHWAALVFIAGIGVHMLRVFFTGAFRKPRELNWAIGFILFVLALLEGLTGYSLPDDVLSGNGLRIIDGIMKGLPLIGTWTSFLFFGGEFPGTAIVGRLYSLHILLLPAILVGLLVLHLMLMVINKHTQFAGAGRTNSVVVGYPFMPVYMSKMGGFLFITFGVIVLIASLFTINPIWNYGPYDPSPVSAGTQPDWYIGFADGALRLVPPGWEFVFLNRTWSLNILIPGAVFSLFMVVVLIYPFIEAWITGDKREHHIAERPRNAATRTAIGAAGVTFYAVLWAAASSDIIATHFWLTMEGVIHALQALLFIGPVIAYFVTKRIALALQKKDREIAIHGYESGRIVRLPGGEYVEVHQPVDGFERFKLADFGSYEPLIVRPNAKGRIPWHENIRAVFSRWLFEDRLTPVTQGELDAALTHQHHELEHIATEEDLEIQGAHERAGVPDAPHTPIDDGRAGEVPVRPSNVIVPDSEPGTKPPRDGDKGSDQ